MIVVGPDVPAASEAITGVDVPAKDAHLIFDVDRGRETLGMTPDDALPRILAAGRSPLTAAGGIAHHHPAMLEKSGNHHTWLGAVSCGGRFTLVRR